MFKSVKDVKFKLFLLLSFALVLRVISSSQSLWLDEAISWEAATNFSFVGLLTKFSPYDFNPPLHYLILNLWLKVFPATEFFLRLPSIIFALLTVFFTFKIHNLVFKNKNKTESLAAGLLLATSGLHVYYSQEARMYSLATLGVTASCLFFLKLLSVKALSKDRNSFLKTIISRDSLFYVFFSLLAFYSHYLTLFVFASQLVFLFLFQKKQFKKALVLFFILFVFFLPWLPVFLNQFGIGRTVVVENQVWSNVLGTVTLKNIFLLPVKFIIGRTSFINKNIYAAVVGGLLFLFSFLLFAPLRLAKKEALKNQAFFWLWLLFPPLLGGLISFKIPVFSYFRFLYCLPPFYILLTRGIFRLKQKKIFLTLVLTINLFFSLRYLFNPDFHRENWKDAVLKLHQLNTSNSQVLLIENVAAPFRFYDNSQTETVYFSEKELIANKNEVFLIPYAQPIFYPNDEVRRFLEAKGFARVYEEHFRGVTLEKWQKLLAIDYNKAESLE